MVHPWYCTFYGLGKMYNGMLFSTLNTPYLLACLKPLSELMGFILIIFIYGLIITFPVCLMAGLLTLGIHISSATILSS